MGEPRKPKRKKTDAASPSALDGEAYRAIVETAVDAVIVIDDGGTVQAFNRAAERMFGHLAPAVIGRNVNLIMPEPDRSRHDGYIARYLSTGERRIIGIGREVRGRRADGSIFPLWLSVAEWFEDGRRYFTGVLHDETQRHAAEERLRASEERFRLLVDGVKDYAVYMIDPDGRVATWNEGAERIIGYREAEILGRRFTIFYPAVDVASGAPARALGCARAEHVFRSEGLRVRKDGSTFVAEETLRCLEDVEGVFRGYAVITRDLSEPRHYQLLVAELRHRLKNSLAVVQALTSQTLRDAPSLDAARRSLKARLAALSRAHDVLTEEGGEGADIGLIVATSTAAYGDGARFTASGPAAHLGPTEASSLALILHELATNAAKYGALSTDTGRIEIDWTLDEGERRLQLCWREHGGPPVSPPQKEGFGSRMLKALVYGLGGALNIDYSGSGVSVSFDLRQGGSIR